MSRNLNIDLKVAEKTEIDYFNTFTGLREHFKKAAAQPVRDGYVLLNNISRRKSYIDFYQEFKELEAKTKVNDFWTLYREEKEKNSDKFINELKPLVSTMFRMKGQIERRGLNYTIQGTSADMSKLAVYKFYTWLIDRDLFDEVLIVTIVHDEINVEAPAYIADEVKDKLIECMIEAGKVFCKTIPIDASFAIGNHWIH